ncbi:hypothetical protein ACFFX0_03330 [Citricoccus parietis]|uniref:Uncharacterized protein n=1 Tax=Citricoccus parietis TaxID=592307 RepID=A0ABV5FUC5_9MICC
MMNCRAERRTNSSASWSSPRALSKTTTCRCYCTSSVFRLTPEPQLGAKQSSPRSGTSRSLSSEPACPDWPPPAGCSKQASRSLSSSGTMM